MIRMLVVEENEKLNADICMCLKENGFQIEGCTSLDKVYEKLQKSSYELFILDSIMRRTEEFELLEKVRKMDEKILILILSEKGDLMSKQRGFDIGADDYMVKPIELSELLMRVKALIRRSDITYERKITVGNFEIDGNEKIVKIGGETIKLTKREFDIIYKMVRNPRKIFSRAQLMNEFWEIDTASSLRSVDVYITKLREKLSGCDGLEIVTVRSLGYKVVFK